jgi:hypothetical protein
MTNIYNLFKFIESKEPEYKAPLKFLLKYDPDSITKEDLHVKGSFLLNDGGDNDHDKDITSLPDGMTVDGDFYGDFYLTSLPNNLTVEGNLLIPLNKHITSLPKNLKVGGNLGIWGTPLAKKYTEEELEKITPGVNGRIYTEYEDYYNGL